MRILVLGAGGMLGHMIYKLFQQNDDYEVWGTLRRESGTQYFTQTSRLGLVSGVDVLNCDSLVNLLSRTKPEVVINCVGLIKQLADANDPLTALPLNSMFPHRLSKLCALAGARLIHISTDCVFSGRKGNYRESDISDAVDLYGKSKYIGELREAPHAVTLRTSIIGHELSSNNSLIDWFLSQEGEVKGYAKAVFSGLPTIELARVIKDYVLPNKELNGLYHVAAKPIDKLSLLRLVSEVYEKDITIHPDEAVCIDRSLDASMFYQASGYVAPDWPELIKVMKKYSRQ